MSTFFYSLQIYTLIENKYNSIHIFLFCITYIHTHCHVVFFCSTEIHFLNFESFSKMIYGNEFQSCSFQLYFQVGPDVIVKKRKNSIRKHPSARTARHSNVFRSLLELIPQSVSVPHFKGIDSPQNTYYLLQRFKTAPPKPKQFPSGDEGPLINSNNRKLLVQQFDWIHIQQNGIFPR